MSSTRRTTRLLGLAAALALATPNVIVAQNVRQQSSQVTRGDVAEQLGAKVTSSQNEELAVGSSLTGSLVDPAKLTKFGISGMHEGARVSVMRVAPDKLRVEVDELEPTPQTKKATLKIDDKGRLAPSAS
jgi:D-serine deaminase-like pyridoxal phosphate-dependent protein